MNILWFCLVALMVAGYVILDGFDLGVGIVHLYVARTKQERRQVIRSIGPVWDGNEVWLLAAGGILFCAFPLLYASSFSGFYLPLMLVLWLLILRGLSIELRSHVPNDLWRSLWDVVFSGSSLLLAIAFGALMHATPFGRSLFAIGWNKEAALYAGIRVKRVKTVLYMISGLIGALAGVLYTFRLSTAEFDNGSGLVLSVIAVVLLGGVSIFGGKGTLFGVFLAVIVFCSLQNALLLTNFPEDATGIVTGGLLLGSVLLPNGGTFVDRLRGHKARRHVSNAP